MKTLITAVLGLALCGAALADDPKPSAKAGATTTMNQGAAQNAASASVEQHRSEGANDTHRSEGANDFNKSEGANDHPKTNNSANIQH
jgi:hypothetical protein